MNSLLSDNRKKLYELDPNVHWAAFKWLDECFEKGIIFRVTEVYRSQERQVELYAQGRWKEGPIVTWTLQSLHTKRLACDIYLTRGTHKDVENIARKYGITHPLALDPPHYQFDRVGTFPIVLSVEAKLKSLMRGIERATKRGLQGTVNVLKGTLNRLQNRV